MPIDSDSSHSERHYDTDLTGNALRQWAIDRGLIVPNPALADAMIAHRSFLHASSVGPSRALPWWRREPTLSLDRAGREAARRRIAGEPEPGEAEDATDDDRDASDLAAQ